MNLKVILQGADPIRHESPHVDTRPIRARVVDAAQRPAHARAAMFGRVAVIAAAAIVALAVLVGTQLLPQAAVRFEVRLAEDQPAAGLQATRIANSNRTIYLHPEVVLTNADIASSRVVPGANASQFWIDVHFTQAGATKIHDATANHLGKPVAILLDGDIVMAPTVRSAIGDAAVINGDYTRAQADRIVSGMSLDR
jgi:preprotein translocase subunit SecD